MKQLALSDDADDITIRKFSTLMENCKGCNLTEEETQKIIDILMLAQEERQYYYSVMKHEEFH